MNRVFNTYLPPWIYNESTNEKHDSKHLKNDITHFLNIHNTTQIFTYFTKLDKKNNFTGIKINILPEHTSRI